MRSLRFVATVIATLAAGAGQAAEDGFYIGAAALETQTRHKVGVGDVFDDEDSSSKLIAGWRPVDWFAIEGSYVDLGDITLSRAVPDLAPFKLEQKAYDVFGVLFKEFTIVDVFVKAGAVWSSADLTMSTIAGPASSVDHDTDFAWGAGVQVRLRKLAARVEYERLEISNGDSFKPPKVVSVGVLWTF